MRRIGRILATAAVLALGVAAWAEEWPQYRGPRRDGISQEKDLLATWPKEGPKKVWSIKAGLGYASPVAFEGKLYLFASEDKKDVLMALDPATGKELWRQVSETPGWAGQYPGARCSPVIDEGKIYTLGAAGDLVCRDLNTGKLGWTLDVLKETAGKNLTWGVASNPLIDGGRIFVQGGDGGSIALCADKILGKVIWKSEATGVASYATPVLVDTGGAKQLLIFGGESLVGMDPETGKTLWGFPWKTSYKINACMPLFEGGHLLAASAYGHGSMTLELSGKTGKKISETKDIQSRFQGMILDGGHVYVNSEGTLKCLTWPDLKTVWAKPEFKLGLGGSLLRVGDKLILLSDSGRLFLIKATPEGTDTLGEMMLFKGAKDAWATPLIYQGKLYVKGPTELVCFDISAK